MSKAVKLAFLASLVLNLLLLGVILGQVPRGSTTAPARQQRMEEALAAYGKAADYGIAEVTTAANYEIAELYHALSKDLYASERPPELTADELEQYDILLEEQAFPFEEEAIELHETNAARTTEGVYDEWVRKSFAALVELLPGRYAKAEIGETLVEAIR